MIGLKSQVVEAIIPKVRQKFNGKLKFLNRKMKSHGRELQGLL